MRRQHRRLTGVIALALVVAGFPALNASALAPQTSTFQRTWERTDLNPTVRPHNTWIWGPGAFSSTMLEKYAEAPGGWRTVQYFDKSRMEDNSYRAPNAPWDVSNGLLVNELISGEMQVGDYAFETREPARTGIAGDLDDTSGVSYSFMGLLLDLPAAPEGGTINRILTPNAADNLYESSDALAAFGITDAHYVPETQHTVAQPFWDFMTASGQVYENGAYASAPLFESPYYATGLPITDAYWANVKVGGTLQNILVQCFERRCLTYTPNNAPEWRVEMGNVGQHYYTWRHGTDIPVEPPMIDIGTFNQLQPAPLFEWPIEHDGDALFVLQNDSPYLLNITFDGPTRQVMTVLPNPDGVVYQTPADYPGCDDDGPTAEVLLPPGNYRVKLDYIDGSVAPGRGYWTLIPNASYGSCFYAVNQDVPGPDPDPTTPTTGSVTITDILWDSPVPDEVSGEYIVLQNTDDHPIQLQGWQIVDIQDNSYTFPNFVLQPGTTVTIHNCTGQNDASNLYTGACEATWNNGGDTATLLNAIDEVVDTYSY